MKHTFMQILDQMNEGQPGILVTLVEDRGSAPRSAGARMLVGPSGRICGTIGGGAVEKIAVDHAVKLTEEKHSDLRHFNLNTETEDNIGMICGGDVRVLFRYIPADSTPWRALAEKIIRRITQRQPAWLAEQLDGEDVPFLFTPEEAEKEGITGTGNWLTDDYFAEPLPLGERAVIFGGGHVSQALVPLLASVDFRPVIFENRAEYAKPELFPGAEATILGNYDHIADSLELKSDDFVVVVTNGHAFDYTVEYQTLLAGVAYLGVIGSKAKTKALNLRLLANGITQEQIDTVYTPIGVKIRAETPAEIAVSIGGEMIRVRAELREAQGVGRNSSCPM